MRVLVTGGTGYLGAAIVRALADRGHSPVVFARHATRSSLPGTLIDGDIRSRTAIESAARQADAICHTAALVSVWQRRREDFTDVNIGGLQNVLEVCRIRNIERLIYTSSFLALPPAGKSLPLAANDYQRTKAAALEIARTAAQRGAPITTLVPGVIYGPGPFTESNLVGRLLRDHLRKRLPGLVGADRQWSYAWIDDVAEAHVAALERAHAATEHVIGGENAPQMRVFEILRELTGRRLPRRIPLWLATVVAATEEAAAHLLGRTPRLTRATVEIFRHDWPLDSQRSIERLGYSIRPLEQGIAAMLKTLL